MSDRVTEVVLEDAGGKDFTDKGEDAKGEVAC